MSIEKFSRTPKMQLHLRIVLWILISTLSNSSAIRARRSVPMMDDDTTIRTEFVDRNNRTILAMFNLTKAQLDRIYQSNTANNEDHSAQARDNQRFDVVKEYRINDIKNRLQSAFHASTSEESQEHPQHEMAAYPICNSESTESSWLQDNNVTIRFSDSLFEPKHSNLNLDSAILRLYKVNPNGTDDFNVSTAHDETKSRSCNDPLMLSPQIRVTVSIVQQLRRNKRERKKRICNTIMMNVSKTGWVEIDIKRAIYIWENVERQQQQQHTRQQPVLVGYLLIEVHDEEERPLKPGLFFNPPKCDQADLAIPWKYYGPHTSMSNYAASEVPRYPRLDVKLIGYASFAPRNYNKELHDKLRRNLRRQLYNRSKASSEESAEYEFTTSTTSTSDNLIASSVSTGIHQHNARKRHSDHNSHHYIHHSHHTHIATDVVSPHEHVVHSRHRRHHHHHQHHHHQLVQQQLLQPQQLRKRQQQLENSESIPPTSDS